jgi:hypothetical protein
MFTVLHVHDEDDRSSEQTLYQTDRVTHQPEKEGRPAYVEFIVTGGFTQLYEGHVFIMNDCGKTVARHKLG